jgi:hypothetical protein
VDTDPAKGGARDGGPGEGSDIVLELYDRRVLAPVGLEAMLNPASVAYWWGCCVGAMSKILYALCTTRV